VNIILQVSLIIGIVMYFILLFYFIKKESLNLKYTLLWILSGMIMLLLVIFPNIMKVIITILGIVDVTNGLFALMLFFVLIILMSITGIVSKMNERNRKLIQGCALMEKRIRELEKHKDIYSK